MKAFEESKPERLPAVTSTIARLPHGLPVDRLPHGAFTDRTHTNKWGTVTITGRLFGPHDLLRDVLLSCGEQIPMIDGGLSVLIHRYALARRMGLRRPSSSDFEWVQSLLEDLRTARLVVEDREWKITCGIVSEYRTSSRTDEQGRPLYVIVFHREYVRLLRAGLGMFFSERDIERLAELPSTVRAVVRFMRSHSPGPQYRYQVDTVLHALFPPGGAPSTWSDRRRVVRRHAGAMKDLGVHLDGDLLSRPLNP